MTQESNNPPITDALWRQMRADITKEAKQRETLAEKDALIKELVEAFSVIQSIMVEQTFTESDWDEIADITGAALAKAKEAAG